MTYPARQLVVVLAAFATAACSSGGSAADASAAVPPMASWRETLTPDELNGNATQPPGPVLNVYYLPIGAAGPARHALSGVLTVPEVPMAGTTPDANYGVTGLRIFPGFSVEFVSRGDYLVPAERDLIQPAGSDSFWTLILSAGRVWSEPSDHGWSRASFPFVLASNLSNEAHNGVATFLFDDNRVSNLHFQVVQETAAWNRNDFWGQVPMNYSPGPVADEAVLIAGFDEEIRTRVPVRKFSDLGFTNPDLAWNRFTRGLSYDDVSLAGFVLNGELYLKPCATRFGDFPYCTSMRHGAFSVTKSLGGSLALMRLAQKYGVGVLDLRISDYVAIAAQHDGWRAVTFIDALNMATGIGDNFPDPTAVQPFADENKPRMAEWSRALSAADKLRVSLSYGDYPWGPGEVFRYNTTHTFIAAAAMDAFVKSIEGPQVSLWDMVREEVLRPIGIRNAPMMHTREPDGSGGLPLLGIGYYPTADDIAKIATLLQNRGRHEAVQLLHAGLVDQALHRTGAGLPTGEMNAHGSHRYNLSFWSLPYRSSDHCVFQLPYMEGFGGSFVMLLPNGVSAFRFADAGIYDVEPLAVLGETIAPYSCDN